MLRKSFVTVKAHLSEVLDRVEHRGVRVVVLRHGKPAAAIVPVSDLATRRAGRARPLLGRAEVDKLLGRFGRATPATSAVRRLLADRR